MIYSFFCISLGNEAEAFINVFLYLTHTAQKMKVTFTEEILNGKVHFCAMPLNGHISKTRTN